MTDEHAHLTHHRTVFDGWKSISIALYMSLVGYGVLVGVPVISTAWVNLLGFTEIQVGRVAGADREDLKKRLHQGSKSYHKGRCSGPSTTGVI